MAQRVTELSQVLGLWREGILRDTHVSFAGEIVRYDANTQLAEVQPLIAEAYTEEDGTVSQVQPPILTNVPVVFPGGGGHRLTFPVAVGESVLIVIQDRSHDAWQDQGGKQGPRDLRRHDLSDAVAIIGLHDNKHPWSGASTTDTTLGKDGGAQLKIADAQATLDAASVKLGSTSAAQSVLRGDAYRTAEDAYLGAFAAAIAKIGAALVALGDSSATTEVAAVADAATTFNGAAASFKSNKVKVE